MIVLGISYHISLPMETLPIVNKDHIKTRLWVGSQVKTMVLVLGLYLNKNSNMILHEFHSFDQLVIVTLCPSLYPINTGWEKDVKLFVFIMSP